MDNGPVTNNDILHKLYPLHSGPLPNNNLLLLSR